MSDCKVTENLVQRNTETTATLSCSCGLSVKSSLRRKNLRAMRVELAKLHEAKPEPKKEKKSRKKQPPVVETAPETDEEQEPNEDEANEGGDQS